MGGFGGGFGGGGPGGYGQYMRGGQGMSFGFGGGAPPGYGFGTGPYQGGGAAAYQPQSQPQTQGGWQNPYGHTNQWQQGASAGQANYSPQSFGNGFGGGPPPGYGPQYGGMMPPYSPWGGPLWGWDGAVKQDEGTYGTPPYAWDRGSGSGSVAPGGSAGQPVPVDQYNHGAFTPGRPASPGYGQPGWPPGGGRPINVGPGSGRPTGPMTMPIGGRPGHDPYVPPAPPGGSIGQPGGEGRPLQPGPQPAEPVPTGTSQPNPGPGAPTRVAGGYLDNLRRIVAEARESPNYDPRRGSGVENLLKKKEFEAAQPQVSGESKMARYRRLKRAYADSQRAQGKYAPYDPGASNSAVTKIDPWKDPRQQLIDALR